MPVDLQTLQRRRDGYRGRATTAVNTALTVSQGAVLTVAQLQGQIDVLSRLQTTLDDHDLQILDYLTEADDIEAAIADSGTYQDLLTITLSNLQDARTGLVPQNNVPIVVANANPGDGAQGQGHAISRLPQLELPKFSADPLQWASFWDSFESSIHSNARLSDVDKFNYLRSLLKGVALDSIAGIAITNASYTTTITLIQNRFGQRQAIINAHVEGLVNIPKATDDTFKLRALYDNAEIHIRGLETLGTTAMQNGAILTPILLTKIPEDIRLIITRKNDGPIGDLDRLRELLRIEIEARELSMLSRKPCVKAVREAYQEFTTGSLMNSSARMYCKYCTSTSHRTNDCCNYPSLRDRESKVWKEKLCCNCLAPSHPSKDCPSRYSCQLCHGRHHTTLCRGNGNFQTGNFPHPKPSFKKPWNLSSRNSRNSNVNLVNSDQMFNHHQSDDARPPTAVNASSTLLSNTSSVWMQTAVAKISDATGKLHDVRLLFDTGSDRSYITSALAENLSLHSNSSEFLSIAPFGQQRSSSKRFDVTNFECTDLDGDRRYQLSAVIVPTITCPIYRASIQNASATFNNLKLADPPKQSSEWMTIGILIGLDHYWELVQDQVVRLPDEGLIAMSSVFGRLVSGAIHDGRKSTEYSNNLFIASSNCVEDSQLTKFWQVKSLNDIGIDSKLSKIDDDLVLRRFDNTITIQDNRYEVGLPWKEDGADLPSNYRLTVKRFKNLINRLTREDLIPQYNDVIADQLKQGFIEEVRDINVNGGVVHYIPHHPVIRKDHATTKLRVVYDASAKMSQAHPSLNDSLYSGPNLISDLMQLLLEFRRHKIVLLADIEKAFLQVGLHPEDRDATRFFWLKDTKKPLCDDNVIIYRFCRVPFGATSSPFLLAATLRYHLMHTDGEAAVKMLNHFYVDNLVTGVTTVTEAIKFYAEAKKIMSNIGMNLREWVSNCVEFNKSIPQADRATGSIIKVLGIPWNVSEDLLHVKGIPTLCGVETPSTKRQILQTIAKLFDPLGLVSPVVIKAKIFLQELWKVGIPWDAVPADELLETWKDLNSQLSELDSVKVPRHLNVTDNCELHVFVDASSKAYAAVAYVRYPVGSSKDEYKSNLVCSKSKVAPIKAVTTPRLELIAALIGCQLAAVIQKSYSFSSVQLWSDNEVVLHWISNPTNKQGVFVSNRIKSVIDYGFSFRYVPTKENPADLPSRGVNTSSLMSSIW